MKIIKLSKRTKTLICIYYLVVVVATLFTLADSNSASRRAYQRGFGRTDVVATFIGLYCIPPLVILGLSWAHNSDDK